MGRERLFINNTASRVSSQTQDIRTSRCGTRICIFKAPPGFYCTAWVGSRGISPRSLGEVSSRSHPASSGSGVWVLSSPEMTRPCSHVGLIPPGAHAEHR